MNRDYKARTNSRSQRGRHSSGFFWFVTGAVVGAFGVGLAWTLQDARQSGPSPATAGSASTEQRPSTKPRFDFYNMLPEMEVVVPDEELVAKAPRVPRKAPPPQSEPSAKPAVVEQDTAAKEPPAAKETPAANAASYLLQVASFSKAADAERLKAQLALLGMQAQIQKVTINGTDTYHRVRAGPYKGKDATNQARSLLRGKGLESITIKLK